MIGYHNMHLYYLYLSWVESGSPYILQFLTCYAGSEEQAIEIFRETFYSGENEGKWDYMKISVELLTKEQVEELGYQDYDKLELIKRPI